jgi:hypothetical protein
VINRVRPVSLTSDRHLPLPPGLEPLFPGGGLRRGSTVVVTSEGQGAHSLAFSLAAAASATGSWCGAVGFGDLGLVAVAELGVALDRLALVPRLAPDQWVTVVGALIDAVETVIARPPAHLRLGDARRLTSRARERGTILVPVLGSVGRALGNRHPWADGADVRLVVAGSRWEGPGAGDGHLTGRRLDVVAEGRGAAARQRRIEVSLPAGGASSGVPSLRSVV